MAAKKRQQNAEASQEIRRSTGERIKGKARAMPVYSVLEPPSRSDGRMGAPEDFSFVRDGFNWAAFLFGPLWMLWRRLWLVFVIYLIVMAAFELVFRLLGLLLGARLPISFLIALLIGLEAAGLRRWTLCRRGWRDRGVVVADGLESAERRFFSGWTAADSEPKGAAADLAIGSTRRMSASPPKGVIGLFPQPGGSR